MISRSVARVVSWISSSDGRSVPEFILSSPGELGGTEINSSVSKISSVSGSEEVGSLEEIVLELVWKIKGLGMFRNVVWETDEFGLLVGIDLMEFGLELL